MSERVTTRPQKAETRPTKGLAPDSSAVRGLGLRIRQWRNALLGSPEFRSRIQRFPATKWLANKKANTLFRLTAGFVHSQVLAACVKLRVFDHLRDRSLKTAELAERCDLPEARMRLLLEQAARLGLVRQTETDGWILDDAGVVVATDPGIAAMIAHHDMLYQDLADPATLLRAPETDTQLKRFWAYARNEDPGAIDPDRAASYSGLMQASQSMLADCILAAHDFGHYKSIMDVGGGDGTFLAAAAAAHPHLALHLFELPPVAELARRNLSAKSLGARSELHSGDFAADPIPATADCVCLIRILCDHDDARALAILNNLHRSLAPGTRVMIAEAMAGPSEGAQLAAVYFSLYFLAMGSGRCRTDAAIKGLLVQAGFGRPHTVATPNPLLATLVFAER